jgi:ApaG protein
MYTAITSGIHVQVSTQYEPAFSHPDGASFYFSYFIRIENRSDQPVQLLRRQWTIFDSVGLIREVEGPGVVGATPIIQPKRAFEYNSACDLQTTVGSMRGFYTMQNIETGQFFDVRIPVFRLEAPWILN